MVEDMVLYSELSLLLIAVIRTIHGINLLRSKCICFYGNIFFIKKSVHKGMYQSPRKGQNRSATDSIQHILCTSTPTEINATPSVYEWFSSDPIIFKQFIKVFQWFSKLSNGLKVPIAAVFFGASHIFPIVQTVFTKFPNATEFSQAN
jgi:hypothetical protein